MQIHAVRKSVLAIILAAVAFALGGTLAAQIIQRDTLAPSALITQPASRVTVSGQVMTIVRQDDRVFAGTWCCQKKATSADGSKTTYESCMSTGSANSCPVIGADCRGDSDVEGTTVTCYHGKS